MLGGVLLSRTLAGAVPSALSGLASGFGMDAGRFPVAVTTETTTWAVLDRRLVRLYSVVRVTASSQPTHALARGVCGWWCGLGVDRIVDASRFLTVLTPHRTWCVACVGVLLFVLAY